MKSLSYLNKYFLKYKYRLILGIFFIVLSNIFALYPAQIVRETVNIIEGLITDNEVITKPTQITIWLNEWTDGYTVGQTIVFFAALVFVLAIIKGLFIFFMRQTLIIMSRLIEFDLKNEIYRHYQELGMTFYKKNRTGDIMNRISEDVSRVRMYLGPGIMYTLNLIVLFVLVVSTMYQINAELTFYVLIPLPVLAVLIYFISNIINKKSERVQQQLSRLSTIAQENYSGIRIIKAFTREDHVEKTFAKSCERYKEESLNLVKVEARFMPVMLLLIGLSTLITVYVGGLEVIKGNLSIGNIAEFVIYVNMLTWPVTALGWVTSLTQRAAASQKRINEFLQTTPEINSGNISIPDENLSIEFKNVSFVYPESGIKALDNVTFKVNPNERVAIVGKTGSGKSTILNLICRFYDVTSGEILIGGVPIQQVNLSELRKKIGYVPQDGFLFSDTISNNVRFGSREEVTDEQLKEVIGMVGIYNELQEFPEKLETVLGERGITVSGGQKQRLSMARAIAGKPELLMFDDSLSAVDTKTESLIIDNLDRSTQSNMMITVSHRISSILYADRILVLNNGEIVEEGKHDQLIKKGDFYATMYEQQLHEDQSSFN